MQISERDFASMGAASNKYVSQHAATYGAVSVSFFEFVWLTRDCRLDVPRPLTAGGVLESRGSLSSLSSIQTSFSKFSAESIFSRRPSIASQTTTVSSTASFDFVPTLVKTPWEQERSRRGSAWRGREKLPLPARFFQQMPPEIYQCVLRQLESVHFERPSSTCVTCYLEDLFSLTLVNRAWSKEARRHMYVVERATLECG